MTTLATRSPTSMTSSSTAATRSDLTPFLRLDPRVITRRFADLSTALPGTAIRYAVKANPNPEVLRTLVRSGSGFEVASPAEVVACLAAGATPDQLLYSNPIKRRTDLKIAYDSASGCTSSTASPSCSRWPRRRRGPARCPTSRKPLRT